MEPLVSVIIPVYNVLPYLREALDSVVHQTYKNLEIIIVDDGSTDGSSSVCDEYRFDSRVQVVHQENKGLSGARNTGLDLMTGEYVAFLDSDDALHPDMIHQMLNAIIRHDANMVSCGFLPYETNDCLLNAMHRNDYESDQIRVLTKREALTETMENRFSVAVWNKLYHRYSWQHLRFVEGSVYEDLRIAPAIIDACNRIAVLPQCLVYYRIRNNSISHTFTEQNLQDHLAAQKSLIKYAETFYPPISSNSIQAYNELFLHTIMSHWIELSHTHKYHNHSNTEYDVRKMIQKSFSSCAIGSKKVQIMWWLFRFCPSLLYPAKSCYQVVKHYCRKNRVLKNIS